LRRSSDLYLPRGCHRDACGGDTAQEYFCKIMASPKRHSPLHAEIDIIHSNIPSVPEAAASRRRAMHATARHLIKAIAVRDISG
jgi:hypothetical protein